MNHELQQPLQFCKALTNNVALPTGPLNQKKLIFVRNIHIYIYTSLSGEYVCWWFSTVHLLIMRFISPAPQLLINCYIFYMHQYLLHRQGDTVFSTYSTPHNALSAFRPEEVIANCKKQLKFVQNILETFYCTSLQIRSAAENLLSWTNV